MLYNKFKLDCVKYWGGYFAEIAEKRSSIKSDGIPLFPTHIMFMRYGNYYGMELLGTNTEPRKLTPKFVKYNEDCDYFNLFNEETNSPLVGIDGGNASIINMYLAHHNDLTTARERFPYIDLNASKITAENGSGSAVIFGPNFESAHFENCVIVNHRKGLFRCKNIQFLAIVSKKIKSPELKHFFEEIFTRKDQSGSTYIRGIFTSNGGNKKQLMASQLQNLYLSRGVHETTIGDFLNQSPEILRAAFNTERFVYEPTLEWVEHDGSVEEKAINPDLFIKRADGKYDIVDLKLAGLNKRNMTKGNRNRRRFVDYVSEGIAQIVNYKFYFTFEKNRNFAFEKYGLEVEDPNLTLVIGSMENVNPAEVIEALKPNDGMNISIIDYDTLVSTFLLDTSNPI